MENLVRLAFIIIPKILSIFKRVGDSVSTCDGVYGKIFWYLSPTLGFAYSRAAAHIRNKEFGRSLTKTVNYCHLIFIGQLGTFLL